MLKVVKQLFGRLRVVKLCGQAADERVVGKCCAFCTCNFLIGHLGKLHLMTCIRCTYKANAPLHFLICCSKLQMDTSVFSAGQSVHATSLWRTTFSNQTQWLLNNAHLCRICVALTWRKQFYPPLIGIHFMPVMRRVVVCMRARVLVWKP